MAILLLNHVVGLFVIILGLSLPSTYGQNTNGSYGWPCIPGSNSQMPCNDLAFLDCNPTTSICECEDPKNMILLPTGRYEAESHRCVLKLDALCLTDDLSAAQCAKYSVCSETDRKCRCKAGHVAMSDGSCALRVGAACDAGGQPCNYDTYLACTNNVCACANPQSTWYNAEVDRCQLLIGSACSATTQQCTSTSHCDTSTRTCLCPPGTSASADSRVCLGAENGGSFGEKCAVFEDCNRDAFLVCGPSFTCVCGWYNSWFNPKSGVCELLANEPCVPVPTAQPCTQYSKCDVEAGYKCICDPGFVTSSHHKCAHVTCECNNAKVKQDSFLVRNKKLLE